LAPLRSGDPYAFEAFYARYFPRVLTFARGRASSERGAQKLTEAILEQAIRMLAQGAPVDSLDTLAMEAARRLQKQGH
jgi:DNA-directed RNA polymerase specialized sigma24 family protein